ncbi:MAG: DNA sulfur modification protein DndD [Proteobacteria bacterium]|nr:DNA sulfur modification protein DndD [Pseudomonadota bacterium]
MWISKIELTNFKSYEHQVFTFPEACDGKNIVLIGGMNGYGKTSILEALYLCLYGKDAINHLARAGLKTEDLKGYPTFLERAFNGEAFRKGSDMMMLRVVINKTKTVAFDISRKWYFRSNGTWTAEEETVVRELDRDVPGTPKLDGRNNFHLSDMLDDFFVPAHIAPFFFFDGEEVKKLADQGRVEQVKQGLEGLLGVVLLRMLSDRLRTFAGQKRNGVVTVDENKLNKLLDTLLEDQASLNTSREKIFIATEKESELRIERESLLNRITTIGGGGGDIATVKDLVEEREQFRNKIKECRKKLEELLTGRLPFHLASKDILNKFKNQIEGEIRYYKWEADKGSLEPRKIEFKTAFNNERTPEINPNLTEAQVEAIHQRIDSAWASLFYPPPEDCATVIIHSYLHELLRHKILEFMDSISLGRQEIHSLLREEKQLSKHIDELARRIYKIEGIDRDGTLATLKDELKEIQDRLDHLQEQMRIDDRAGIALEAKVSSQKAEYEREKKKLDDSSPARTIIEKSERVRKVIDQLIPALFPLKVKELGAAMTKFYKQLAHKDQVAKIEILDNGQSRILGKSNKEITFDRSAGENQIFATALLAGLAQVSGVNAPMVVDTPLGRLDSTHRLNILNFWTDDKQRQVILLSQDEEIHYDFFQQIKGSVIKTYLLEYQDVGDGIGRTTAKEGCYFEGKRQ